MIRAPSCPVMRRSPDMSRLALMVSPFGVGSCTRGQTRRLHIAVALIAASTLAFPAIADARGKQRSGNAQDEKDATAAKNEADAAEHVRKASEALQAHRYDEAMAEFEAGYALVPKPAFILNM